MTILCKAFDAFAAPRAAVLAGTAACAVTATELTATELSDAGPTQASAQNTTARALAALTAINGSLRSTTDADLYPIDISSPAAFSASTVNAVTDVNLDAQLAMLRLQPVAPARRSRFLSTFATNVI